MPSTYDTLSSGDKEVFKRIIRDIIDGAQLGIISPDQATALTEHTHKCLQNPLEWKDLKALHHAHGGFTKLFESAKTQERLRYLRASYLKMLALTNDPTKLRWEYAIATAWKKALLDNCAGFLTGKKESWLQAKFSHDFIYVSSSGRSAESESRGDVGGVILFTWMNRRWAYKAEDDSCALDKANRSGIPKQNAKMNNRSVASFLLAKALGLESIMVKTDFVYFQRPSAMDYGILMAAAPGRSVYIMLPDLGKLGRWLEGGMDFDDSMRDSTCPHRRRDLTYSIITKTPQLAFDLFAANWLDYICAQMDRHLGNLYVDIQNKTYNGLKLIDNDMAFGKDVISSQSMLPSAIPNSCNNGMPHYMPPHLEEKINSISAAIADPAKFWKECNENSAKVPVWASPQTVEPIAPKKRTMDDLFGFKSKGASLSKEKTTVLPKVRQADPEMMACMAGIARLLTKEEFASLAARIGKAARAMTLPLNNGTFQLLVNDFKKADEKGKSDQSFTSYWHMSAMIYDPAFEKSYPLEYGAKPKNLSDWELHFKNKD